SGRQLLVAKDTLDDLDAILSIEQPEIEVGGYQRHEKDVYPPANTGRKFASVRMRATSSRLSPWISIWPSFTVPPAPQAFCIALARRCFSGRPMPTNPFTTVTVLPPRPAFCRMMSTRPRFFRGLSLVFWSGLDVDASGPGGRSAPDKAEKG